MHMEQACLLEIKELSVSYGEKKALDAVSFAVSPGITVGILGESGSGKSTLLKAVAGLLEPPAAADGDILYQGQSLLHGQDAVKRKLMGNEITMIFQNPESYLDPVKRIGRQMEEILFLHGYRNKKEAGKKAAELLRSLALSDPESVLNSYPFELSGGMCQRVSIAMAAAGSRTKLMLADEPTSALDQVVRRTTAELIQQVQKQTNAALLLVTHDMRLARQLADQIGIMYRGRMVEWGTSGEVLQSPCHPYTKNLLEAVPSPESDFSRFRRYLEKEKSEKTKEWISETHWVLK